MKKIILVLIIMCFVSPAFAAKDNPLIGYTESTFQYYKHIMFDGKIENTRQNRKSAIKLYLSTVDLSSAEKTGTMPVEEMQWALANALDSSYAADEIIKKTIDCTQPVGTYKVYVYLDENETSAKIDVLTKNEPGWYRNSKEYVSSKLDSTFGSGEVPPTQTPPDKSLRL